MTTALDAPTATKTRGKILFVDDELVVRDSLGKWFTSEGYTARPAGSAREALEVITREKNAVKLIAQAWGAWDESRKTAVILEGEMVVFRSPSCRVHSITLSPTQAPRSVERLIGNWMDRERITE